MIWAQARQKTWGGMAAVLVLFGLNVWIAHRLFTLEFTPLQSNEAAFIAISRFFHDHWNDLRWFPWFDGGMPIENAYQPVLPAMTATLAGLTHLPMGRAYHVLLALAYCLGPVTLYWFVWDWSASVTAGFLGGLFYSLISPAAMLIPKVRAFSGSPWAAQRLFNLVYFGEDPHILALTLLPVALLFLRRSIDRRDARSLSGAIVFCSAVVLTNAFGAPVLALGALCIGLALRRGFLVVVATGVAAWCWSSPWLPPSLMETIRSNAWSARGQYASGLAAYEPVGVLVVGLAALWIATKRLSSPFERFAWLFGLAMSAFPIAFYWKEITLVPQPHRYQLEFEMGLCILAGTLSWRLLRSGRVLQMISLAGLAFLVVHQVRAYLNFSHTLIKPLEITKTVEYQVTQWIDRNLPGQRVMVSGDAAWVFNVFSDNPQLSSGHEPTAPNFIQQIAVYQIYSGTSAGAGDGDVAAIWLKAFGNQAVTVPGASSREAYKPFNNPDKFAGILPVLWQGGGDTIYAVPQRSHSLAHPIPAESVVLRPPANGLDIEPMRPYIEALDDPALPEMTLRWEGQSKARITGRMMAGEVLSVQVNYDPGWEALVQGLARPVRSDGLGLMVVDTGCTGDCAVELRFGVTREAWACRILSLLASVLLLVLLSGRSLKLRGFKP
ncbi:MAG TPA: hypothetical protein VG273_22780 [Bryobacteraceae bacterium]|nr:hypothetical protein [Bryobacteraceae bacterium]